jgi:hypothetical protein
MTVQYGQAYWHPSQRCNACNGRIAVQPRETSTWGGGAIPMSDVKRCENGCPSSFSGTSGW